MFSLRLKELRINKKLTQIQLSKELKISIGAVGNWEAGKRMPDYPSLLKIADYFHVTVDYLLGRAEPQKQSNDNSNDIPLTSAELSLITAYRNRPEMQTAVNTLLGIARPSPSFREPAEPSQIYNSSSIVPDSSDELYPSDIIQALNSKKSSQK